jgi:hypothetical protein
MTAQKRKRPRASKYEPTDRELTAMRKFLEKRGGQAPGVKVTARSEIPKMALDHPDEAIGLALLMEALGTADPHFVNSLLRQLANAGSQGGEIDEQQVNFMLSVINGVEPRDQVEAMLAAQMAAVHMATMTFARRLAHVENIPQQDSAERAFNKLTRTFAAQMEALKRYRTGGEQKVTVQHVTVSEGGKAIVGNVTQGPGQVAPDQAAASTPLLTDARTTPMPSIDQCKEPHPVPLRRTLKK